MATVVAEIRQRIAARPSGGLTILTLLLGGARFVDGVYVPEVKETSAA